MTSTTGIPGWNDVPQMASAWTWRDRLDALAARCHLRRARDRVEAGLYAIGCPTSASPVLVTANYRLSFDLLRRSLAGTHAWILVLNTRGVNVWCAAGKGAFGTTELVKKIRSTRLARRVGHNTVILPQLGAPGVAAHEVTRQTGFRVVYGPVRAADIPAFLAAGQCCTPAMRRVQFPLMERLAAVPAEMAQRMGAGVGIWLVLLLLASLHEGGGWAGLAANSLRLALGVGSILVAGTVLTPLLLPWLPGRAFAIKGGGVGAALGVVAAMIGHTPPVPAMGFLLLAMAACSYLGLLFTGCTPYTSASGVRREVRRAAPLQGLGAIIGSILWII